MPGESTRSSPRWAAIGVGLALLGSLGLAAFPLLADLPLVQGDVLPCLGVTLALLSSAGAIMAVFGLRRVG